MILFQSDFRRFPSAIVDFETTNESFLRLASIYKKMGIRNNVFHLVLLQPELKGVDPFDPELSEELKVKIIAECTYNPFYFFREVVRIPPNAGVQPIRFKANRGNIALIWCFLCHLDFALIQPRQTGKSVSTDCLMVWLLFCGMQSSKINMITKDAGLRAANVERLKLIRDLLPGYMFIKDKSDANNQHLLTYNTKSTKYITAVAQSSESAALNVGRGTTAPITHMDEGPFINFIGTVVPAALAAGTEARNEAKRNNQPYGNIFTTTAGKKDDRDGKYMYDMIHDGTYWTEIYFDCAGLAELHTLVKRNCSGNKVIINGTFSHRQLGKTDEWLYEAISNANAKGDEADRDFFNKWTSGTQRSPLTPKQNDAIFNSEMEPDFIEKSDEGYMVRWYVPKDKRDQIMKEGHFIAGLDTSEAVGRDSIAFVVLDIRDLSVVAALNINEANIIKYAQFIAKVLIRYINITLIIERKSTGIAIIDALLIALPQAGINPFKRMFNTVVDEYHEKQTEFKEIEANKKPREPDYYIQWKNEFGFSTNQKRRMLLFGNVLQNAANNAASVVHDKVLSAEIRALVTKGDKIDHTASGNDDMVIAWLLANWMLTHGNLLSYYGLPAGQALSLVGTSSENSEQERQVREQRKLLREEIEALVEELKACHNGFKRTRLEHRLKILTKQTRLDGGEVRSFDELMKQAVSNKRLSFAERRKQSANRSLDLSRMWKRSA